MGSLFEQVMSEVELSVPRDWNRPIAIIGAGSIVEVAHLPAYAAAGLPVLGVFDTNQDRARLLAERFGIRCFATLDDVLDSDAEVLDIAVPAAAQPAIAMKAMTAGRHVLCQKPLALTSAQAEELAAHADSCGVVGAVNQQLRYDEGIAATASMMRRGWIGEPLALTIDVNISTDWSTWPWMAEHERLDLVFHSIHYIDAMRGLLGEPSRVYSVGTRVPGQAPVGETRSMSMFSFADGPVASIQTFHENITGDYRAVFRLEGTRGVIEGTFGLLYDYPRGRPDTLRIYSREVPTDGWVAYPVTTRWLPHAFAGPMRDLLRSIAEGGPPVTSLRDNCRTVALVEALYHSHDTGNSVALTEPGHTVPETTTEEIMGAR